MTSSSTITHYKSPPRNLRQTTANTTIPSSNRTLLLGIQLERTTYKLPPVLDSHLVDWNERPSNEKKEIPIFWHILKSGGTTMKLMYATCYRFVEACETGGWIEAIVAQEEKTLKQLDQQQQQQQDSSVNSKVVIDRHDEEIRKSQEIMMAGLMSQRKEEGHRFLLEQWELWQNEAQQPNKLPLRIVDSGDGRKYVNVDVTTPSGIRNAYDRGFLGSKLTLANVIFTPLLVEVTGTLLDGESYRGRLFTVFRHPVDRVVSVTCTVKYFCPFHNVAKTYTSLSIAIILLLHTDKHILLPPKSHMGTNLQSHLCHVDHRRLRQQPHRRIELDGTKSRQQTGGTIRPRRCQDSQGNTTQKMFGGVNGSYGRKCIEISRLFRLEGGGGIGLCQEAVYIQVEW